ncbi:MAG TPA: hypothetical protein VFA04_09985 [Bryobacteraceae bacterium]|nr:hypothetical protein [Bryobacteraceae bacterium]
MRREASYFGDQELELIYIARRLKDALKVETLLTDSGVEYAVETDTYHGGIIFRSERVGAFFYVAPEASMGARQLLENSGRRPWAP